MEKTKMQSNAIDLLNKLIAKNPEKVKEIVDVNSNIDIDGPTYEEYLSSLHEHSILNNCSFDTEVEVDYMRSQPVFINTPLTFKVDEAPPLIKVRKRKKDSVISQSLFFCIILQYVRSKKSRV